MKRAATALTLATLALGGCTSDGGGTVDPSPTASTPASSAPATTAPPTTPPTTAASTGPSCPAAPALPAGATVITATVSGGKVTTAHAQWSVRTGTPVRIAVTADVADEVHVHGYNRSADTTPGCPTAIDFVANIPGTVEVELEKAKLHLFDVKAS